MDAITKCLQLYQIPGLFLEPIPLFFTNPFLRLFPHLLALLLGLRIEELLLEKEEILRRLRAGALRRPKK